MIKTLRQYFRQKTDLDSCDLYQAFQTKFHGHLKPQDIDYNHPLTDGIGQPSKGAMLNVFFAQALNLPKDEAQHFKDKAIETLTNHLNTVKAEITAEDNPTDATLAIVENLQNVLSLQDTWETEFQTHLLDNYSKVYKRVFSEKPVPVSQILAPQVA